VLSCVTHFGAEPWNERQRDDRGAEPWNEIEVGGAGASFETLSCEGLWDGAPAAHVSITARHSRILTNRSSIQRCNAAIARICKLTAASNYRLLGASIIHPSAVDLSLCMFLTTLSSSRASP
jgi:hypothetical protein